MQDYNPILRLLLGKILSVKETVQQNRSLSFTFDLNQTPLGNIQYTIQKFYRINE